VRLAGAVVIVSGASRGIGAATAELLAARGATVVGIGRDEPALGELARSCGISVLVEDLREPHAAEQVVRRTVATHGRVDAVVINAGVGHAGAVVQMPAERIAELVDVNVRGAIQLAAAGAGAIRDTGSGEGAIVFVTSIAGVVGVPGESVYSASKAALEAFAPLLREELRADRIAVCTVLPGVVDTEFFRTRGVPYERRFPRPLPPERVARAVLYAVQSGRPRQIVPRWLAIPAWLSAAAPGCYRWLARHLG